MEVSSNISCKFSCESSIVLQCSHLLHTTYSVVVFRMLLYAMFKSCGEREVVGVTYFLDRIYTMIKVKAIFMNNCAMKYYLSCQYLDICSNWPSATVTRVGKLGLIALEAGGFLIAQYITLSK